MSSSILSIGVADWVSVVIGVELEVFNEGICFSLLDRRICRSITSNVELLKGRQDRACSTHNFEGYLSRFFGASTSPELDVGIND